MHQPDRDQWIAILLIATVLSGVFWMVPKIRYEVDPEFLRVILGPFTMRKIALGDIAFVDTQAPVWNEHWCNCFNARGRIIRIRRKTGMVRNFIITPEDRNAFIASLQERLGPPV